MTHTIRRARPDEAPIIAKFQVAMALESEGIHLDPQVVGLGVQAVFDHPEKGHYWVASEGEKVVASLLIQPEWSDWRNGTVLWIHSVYVVPSSRRQGLFKKMYKVLQKEVHDNPNLKGLRLYVDRRNTSAREVYASLGMDGEHYIVYEALV